MSESDYRHFKELAEKRELSAARYDWLRENAELVYRDMRFKHQTEATYKCSSTELDALVDGLMEKERVSSTSGTKG